VAIASDARQSWIMASSSSGCSGSTASKKRGVSVATVEKWIQDYDRDLNTVTWLQYDEGIDRFHASKLRCRVCKRFADKISSSRDFNLAFIEGSANLRTSSFRDHAGSDMHKRAMMLLRREQSFGSTREYSPLARMFSRIEEDTARRLKMQFETAYMIAKEGLAFTKMKPLCYLQEKYGVDLGITYRNDQACASFVGYIAQDLKMQLYNALHEAKFFSIQVDGSTDSANKEEELFLAIYFDPHSNDCSVHIRNQYFVCANLNPLMQQAFWSVSRKH